jgi:CheY-like chemotaxis protein
MAEVVEQRATSRSQRTQKPQKDFALWLIDDDESERFLVRKALDKAEAPVNVEMFSSPADAIRRLESQDDGCPTMIICDVHMPGMNGLEFLKWVRGSRFAALPFIIRSNSGLQRDVNNAYECGANCYLQKGATLDDVQQNLKVLLQFWKRMCLPEVKACKP